MQKQRHFIELSKIGLKDFRVIEFPVSTVYDNILVLSGSFKFTLFTGN